MLLAAHFAVVLRALLDALDVVDHFLPGEFGVAGFKGLEDLGMFRDGVVGVRYAQAAKEAETLHLATQRVVGGQQELIVRRFGNEPVEPLIRFPVRAELGERRAARCGD